MILTKEQVANLASYLENNLDKKGCDHKLTLSLKWAKQNKLEEEDFIELLEEHGGYCDCEVVLNLPEDEDLVSTPVKYDANRQNPWQIPNNFDFDTINKKFIHLLVSSELDLKYCYTKPGEILIPAPTGVKPKQRIRKSDHFFIGLETGNVSIIGCIKACDGITAGELVKNITDSGQKNLRNFGLKEAGFYLTSLEGLKVGDAICVEFKEIVGISSKRTEIRMYKILLR